MILEKAIIFLTKVNADYGKIDIYLLIIDFGEDANKSKNVN